MYPPFLDCCIDWAITALPRMMEFYLILLAGLAVGDPLHFLEAFVFNNMYTHIHIYICTCIHINNQIYTIYTYTSLTVHSFYVRECWIIMH